MATTNTPAAASIAAPSKDQFEPVCCYYCGADTHQELVVGQDDLTGKPGDFQFVVCDQCGLAYQSPRLTLEHIRPYYDDEYISHRQKTDWGMLTWFYNRGMNKHDQQKDKLSSRYVDLQPGSRVLDVGCGSGSFLQRMRQRHRVEASGVDFKDLTHLPFFEGVDFHCGLFYEQDLPERHFDLITMWHFLEHDYDPLRTLATARRLLKPDGRLVIEVPRLDSVSFRLYRERWPGLQAPQHTALYTRQSLRKMVEKAGLEVVEQLPYGAFPPYFYLFTGAAFKILKGKGLNLQKAILPYFVGQVALTPVLLLQRWLNLAMQTVVCRAGELPNELASELAGELAGEQAADGLSQRPRRPR